MDNIRLISSDQRIPLSDLSRHFKVIAGPGAGKTHWLVEHIKNVLQNAENLTYTSKIACITYTTVGAEEIQSRLGMNQERVEVSTIHSFLYANVVKPYVYLLNDNHGKRLVNVEELDGHYENIATNGKIYQWKVKTRAHYLQDNKKLKEYLEQLDWKLVDGQLYLKPRKNYRIGKYYIRIEDLPLYKQLFWDEGVIHHEDVLYFSYRILKEFSIILEHLSAKYPYIFLDEFQDTNPIQTEIIKWLGNSGSVIGVVGDPAQSIYEFQGASRQDFIDFTLPNQIIYMIENNRRCGSKIVDFLNHIRKGDQLTQKPTRENSNHDIYFIECTDGPYQAIANFNNLRISLGLEKDYCILTRNNDTVKLLRNTENSEVWTSFSEADSSNRERFIKSILTAYKLTLDTRYEVAIKELERSIKTDRHGELKDPFQENQIISPIMKRSLAVDLLEFLANDLKTSLDQSLFEFYNSLSDFFIEKGIAIKKISRGKIKQFSESITIRNLVDNLILSEEKTTEIRTIHKAKGAEFESVLLYLPEVKDVNLLVSPDINSEQEDTRILYVALSRAKDLLCISCPPLNDAMIKKLEALNVKRNH